MRTSDEEVEHSLEVPQPETQFIPLSDDENTLWEVLEILAEKGNRYRVRWAGNDPATGRPWAPSWVAKEDCTDELRAEWKAKKAAKEKGKQKKKSGRTQASATSSKTSTRSTATPSVATTSRFSHVEIPSSTRKRSRRVRDASSGTADGAHQDEVQQPKKKRKLVPDIALSLPRHTPQRITPPRDTEGRENKEPVSLKTIHLDPNAKIGPPRANRKAKASSANAERLQSTNVVRDDRSGPPSADSHWENAVPDSREVTPRTLGNSRQGKTLRPIPTVSPSVFRSHLLEPEPPMSSIEQFSSPEKGSAAATTAVLRKVREQRRKGKGKAKATRKDEETLRIRGQELAEKARAGNRNRGHTPESGEDQSYLFEPGLSDLEPSAPPLSTIENSIPEESTSADEPIPGERELFSTYVDFNGGHGDARGQSPEMTIGPDFPGRSRASPLSLAKRFAQKRVHEPPRTTIVPSETTSVAPLVPPREADPSFEEPPEPTPTNQAVVDSLSQPFIPKHDFDLPPPSPPPSHQEASSSVANLEHQIIDLRAQVLTLQREKEDLLTETHTLPDLRAQLADREAEAISLRRQNQELVDLPTQIQLLEEENRGLRPKASVALELRLQLTRLQEQNKHLTSERDNALKLQTRFDALQEENKRLTEQCSALKRDKADVESLRDLFQEQYRLASSHASEVDAENKRLEQDLRISRGQVTDGLAMVRGTYTGLVRRLEDELAKYKGLCAVLQARDVRMEDGVRRRAALEPQLREDNARLRAALEKAAADCSRAQEAIAHLLPAEEEAGPEGGLDVSQESRMMDGASSESGDDGPSDADDDGRDAENGDAPSSPAPEAWDRGSPSPPRSDGSTDVGLLYVCQHVADGRMCNATFVYSENVRKHAYTVHYPNLRNIVGL